MNRPRAPPVEISFHSQKIAGPSLDYDFFSSLASWNFAKSFVLSLSLLNTALLNSCILKALCLLLSSCIGAYLPVRSGDIQTKKWLWVKNNQGVSSWIEKRNYLSVPISQTRLRLPGLKKDYRTTEKLIVFKNPSVLILHKYSPDDNDSPVLVERSGIVWYPAFSGRIV